MASTGRECRPMTKISFTKHRKRWYLVSGVIILAGILSMLFQGMNFGIDFTGGNILEIRFESQPSIDELRSFMDERSSQYNLQEAGGSRYILRTEELSESASTELLADLESSFGTMEIERNEKVSASIGAELTNNALMALGIAAVLMIIYITFRFEFFFGLAAVMALLHDVIITAGLFSIFQIEVNSAFVAALLTII